jgi:hypothetical protein
LSVLGGEGEDEDARRVSTYRWTLSVTPETVSVTLSVVDLAVFGVAWSATSGKCVSLQWLGGWEREDVLSWMSLRPVSDMMTVVLVV